MRPNLNLRLITACLVFSSAWGQQPARRFAFVEANGPIARANPIATVAENLITDGLTARLAGKPGYILIDRANVDKILKEQDMQNGNRSDPQTAAKIGKLLGIAQIGLVNLTDLGYSERDQPKFGKVQTVGTTVIRANVRVLDVETAAILIEPSSAFEDSMLMKETFPPSILNGGRTVVVPKGDPEVNKKNEWTKGADKIIDDLAAKVTAFFASSPELNKAATTLVAGIANGSVFINQGTAAGVTKGSKFQVTRVMSLDIEDPATGKKIVRKQQVCVLTIDTVEETNASGTCQGGIPQSKDVAEPIRP